MRLLSGYFSSYKKVIKLIGINFVTIIFLVCRAGADIIIVPKYEYIQNKNSTLASRELAKLKVNYLGGPLVST
ncbi:MAG: hypothetical protein IPK04_17215 [Bdellovibrionales bacterium]|nr:hypothetical protein [Bdellovibrionales bacterium]